MYTSDRPKTLESVTTDVTVKTVDVEVQINRSDVIHQVNQDHHDCQGRGAQNQDSEKRENDVNVKCIFVGGVSSV